MKKEFGYKSFGCYGNKKNIYQTCMINPVWWHKLSNVICLEKRNRLKMRFAKMSQNEYVQMCWMLILTLMHPIIWISGSRWLFGLSCKMFPKCTDEMRGRETKCECVCRLFWQRKPEFFFQSLVTPGFCLPSFQITCILMRWFRGGKLSRDRKNN